jgi:hypothetical protein
VWWWATKGAPPATALAADQKPRRRPQTFSLLRGEIQGQADICDWLAEMSVPRMARRSSGGRRKLLFRSGCFSCRTNTSDRRSHILGRRRRVEVTDLGESGSVGNRGHGIGVMESGSWNRGHGIGVRLLFVTGLERLACRAWRGE